MINVIPSKISSTKRISYRPNLLRAIAKKETKKTEKKETKTEKKACCKKGLAIALLGINKHNKFINIAPKQTYLNWRSPIVGDFISIIAQLL